MKKKNGISEKKNNNTNTKKKGEMMKIMTF